MNWHKMSFDEIVGFCRELTEDPDFPTVRKWKQGGGKVLGHFQVYFPEELAHAAGMLPIKVRGGPVEPRRADSHFGSYLCSILKSSLEMALENQLPLDMFVTHPICDSARNLAGIWARNLNYPAQILYLPQNANSGYAATYLADEYRRLAEDLAAVSGVCVTDEALRRSLELYNQSRELLAELYRLKRDAPWKLSVEEAYVVVAVSGLLPREDYVALLRALLVGLERREVRMTDKIRVVWEGGFCEQPPLEMLTVVGRSCYVVDDDLLIGQRYLLGPVPLEGDPWANLAGAYLNRSSYCPVQHDLRKPKEKMLLERVKNSGAEAVILTAAKMCEPGLDEQVAYAKALDEAGIPYFVSEFEEKMSSFEQLQIQLETFVENLLFAEDEGGACPILR